MNIKNFMLSTVVLVLALPGCDWLHKNSARETIFDRVVNVPKELVLDIPTLPPLCDEMPDLKKGFIPIKNGKLYYEEEGQGIPLVLINGGPGGTHHGFHPYFSQIKDIAQIIYYDQRGTGKSSQDGSGKTYTIKQAVEDLEDLRKELKIEKWALLGWSYGGLLAQLYVLTYPEHVAGLILIASQSGVFDNVMEPVRDRMFISEAEEEAIKNIRKKCMEGKMSLAQCIYNLQLAGDWKRQSYCKPTKDELIRKAFYEWGPAPGFEKAMRADMDKINLEGKFKDFKIPTLIMEGKWDILWWNPDRAEVMKKNHPNAKIKIIEKGGHMMFRDQPEEFFAAIKDFLIKDKK
ncbi:MAG: hypothetical protein UR26_C0002G0152 [candidate division TM6 bacterium GW2011_GWF2_32_72]|nr:MAG: hypothetical protein UR26_C0002G0152 [candidate division TM6 bacterium GW2011_GWF2_32_72]